MSSKLFKGFWNIPNMLSLFRLVLVPILVITYFGTPSSNHIVALVIFLVASVTDVLDGIIARGTGQITPIGTALDPLADKCLKIATLICLCVDMVLPVWLVVLLICIDIAMIVAGLCLFNQQITIPSNIIGKTGTVVMSIGLFMCFLTETFGSWGFYTLCAGLGIIVCSVIVYIAKNAKAVFAHLKNRKLKLQDDHSDAVIQDEPMANNEGTMA